MKQSGKVSCRAQIALAAAAEISSGQSDFKTADIVAAVVLVVVVVSERRRWRPKTAALPVGCGFRLIRSCESAAYISIGR